MEEGMNNIVLRILFYSMRDLTDRFKEIPYIYFTIIKDSERGGSECKTSLRMVFLNDPPSEVDSYQYEITEQELMKADLALIERRIKICMKQLGFYDYFPQEGE